MKWNWNSTFFLMQKKLDIICTAARWFIWELPILGKTCDCCSPVNETVFPSKSQWYNLVQMYHNIFMLFELIF